MEMKELLDDWEDAKIMGEQWTFCLYSGYCNWGRQVAKDGGFLCPKHPHNLPCTSLFNRHTYWS
jgi:hypothetical protein